jgi:hypothetical protein
LATLTIEQGLEYYLTHYAGLVTLISTRTYINRIPQKAVIPCLTFQRISTPRVLSHDTSGLSGTAYPRFQFDSWAMTYTASKAICDQVRAALNGYSGTITSGADSVVLQAALVNDERYNPDLDAGLERLSSDYIIWHLEG